jgi:hypothetical protein
MDMLAQLEDAQRDLMRALQLLDDPLTDSEGLTSTPFTGVNGFVNPFRSSSHVKSFISPGSAHSDGEFRL